MEKNNDIDIYISEISERLKSGHASLMVGAGFSMNALRSSSTAKKFPSWNDLGDIFYKKLHGKHPTDKDKCYLDALKLAEEVEASFGRTALNKILRNEIPNTEYQPSELHEKLLQLPWTDIFTTNYDTLLERTAEKILEQRYETVINKEDLIWSTKPRIIKLHGSFPSETPFIITEEDYRRYPEEYAPFVNTVQQSLLENTLCLVGFSGNDPNFQKWIGWIRDNLGKDNSPKIFLIGKLSLSVGQRRLLEHRNIVTIDLSCYSEDHYKGLSNFVDRLTLLGSPKDSNLDYPDGEKKINFDYRKEAIPQFRNAINKWKITRLAYPNWLILPAENRETLEKLTDISFIGHIKDVTPFTDIEFLYEFNWRFEKCLHPILNNWEELYVHVLAKYNPFHDSLDIPNAITTKSTNSTNVDWSIISNFWCELQISLLRFYREENFQVKWVALSELIEKIKEKLSPDLYARYSYERCLYAMFLLEIPLVRQEISNWAIDSSLPYWEAKRAGILAELGDMESAEKILEASLSEIRNRLRFSPVSTDYTLVSQESYILQLSRYVRRSINFSEGKLINRETKEFLGRWNELVKYKCDPWGDLKSFELSLKNRPIANQNNVEKNYGFKIGSVTTTSHFNKTGKYAFESYAFLRYIEEVGIPLKLTKITFGAETAKNAIACISNYSPNWGFVSFIRTGNNKIVDDIFNRGYISFMSQDECDELAVFYLNILVKLTTDINKGNKLKNENFAISLSTVIPEILSRLCVKNSYNVKIKILDFLKTLYISDAKTRSNYAGIQNLGQFLIKSFSNKEQYYLIPELLSFPILTENETSSFPDLISFIAPSNFQKTIKIKSDIINEMISFIFHNNSERNAAIIRLIKLLSCGLLSKQQQEKFGKALWKNRNSDDLPSSNLLSYCYFLIFPHPKDIIPQERLQNYIKKNLFPELEEKSKSGALIDNVLNHKIFKNLIGLSKSKINYPWSKNEINGLLSFCITWWDQNKKYIVEQEKEFRGLIPYGFEEELKNMIKLFSQIIQSNIDLVDSLYYSKLCDILNELSEIEMYDLEANVSFINIFPDQWEKLCDKIKIKLFSKKEENILDALNAISALLNYGQQDIVRFVNYICENIKHRTDIRLDRFLLSVKEILEFNSKLITNYNLDDLEIGLTFLYEEVRITENDDSEVIHNKILIKRNASHLLAALKKYFIDELNIELPTYIQKWEDSGLDIDEFSEIRNIWLNQSNNE